LCEHYEMNGCLVLAAPEKETYADLDTLDLRSILLLGYSDCKVAPLDGPGLPSASLNGSNLQGLSLVHSNLKNIVLWNANRKNANLGDADLRGEDTTLRCVDCEGANLSRAKLQNF
jgi:uncharacterized protein YjbI with pentapeptide repeats